MSLVTHFIAEAFRPSKAAAPGPDPFAVSSPWGAPPVQSHPSSSSALDAQLGGDSDDGTISVPVAQRRLAAMMRGWDEHGGSVATGGVVPFVEASFSTVSTRMPKIVERFNPLNREWEPLTPSEMEYGRMTGLLNWFRSPDQTPEMFHATMLTYWRTYGQFRVCWWQHDGAYVFAVVPPHLYSIDERGRVAWKDGDMTKSVPAEQSVEFINARHEPGVPWSAWFPVLDHLDRLDQAFASVDRTIDSRLYNSKLIMVRPVNGQAPGWTPASTQAPQTGTGGIPTKAQGVPFPNQGAGTQPQLAQDLAKVGKQRILRRRRRDPQLASPLIGSGNFEIDVVDPTVSLDPALFDAVENDLTAIARATTLPTNLILHGFGEDNHWSAWMTRDEALDSSILPEVHLLDQLFTDKLFQKFLGEFAWVKDPARYRVRADDRALRSNGYSTEEVLNLYVAGIVSADWVRDQLGIAEDAAPETPATEIPADMLTLPDPLVIDRPQQQPPPGVAAAVDWDAGLAQLASIRGW